MGEPVVLGGHLLPRVEHEGHVDRRLGHGRREPHHRQPALHVGAPRPHSTSPSIAGLGLPLTGTVSVWPARISRGGPAELRAGHEVGAHPFDLEVRERPQPRLEVVGERRLSWLTDGIATSSAVRVSRSVGAG